MAINKSFVIKNGVQVSTDLIIGDADNNRVGIGTTIPFYDLHVGRGRKSRGGIGATDLVVSGVATISQLSVTGISTFAGALDVNSTVDFAGDVVFNGTHDITYDQSESAFVFNDNSAIRVGTGSDFSIMHDGNNTILRESGTGGLKIFGNQIELLGSTAGETLAKFTEDGGIELYDDNTKRIETTGLGATVFGDLTVSGVTTSARLLVTGISTFTGLVDANGGAHIDNLRLGIDADNDITTSSGNLTLDSTGGTVEVNDNLQVDGQTDLNGDINLGNATSDTITATGRFDSDIVPSTDGARDLGASGLEFKDLYVDGVGYIDSIESDGGSFGNIQVGETGDNEIDTASLNLILDSAGGTINIDDGITVSGFSTFAGISSFNNDLNVGITTFFVDKSTGFVGVGTNVPTATLEIGKTAGTGIGVSIFENGNACFSGIVTVGGNLVVGGTINLGDANTDNVVFNADVDSNIVPDDDDTYDLGSSTKEWRNLFIDGTAKIDALEADTAKIGDLTDNRVVIAGTSGELEDSANLTFDGSTLAITGSIDLSADIDVDGTANLDTVDIDGTTNFGDDITFQTANGNNIVFDKSDNDVTFGDSVKLRFGDSNDLSIEHDGGNSYISDGGTGALFITGSEVSLKSANTTELMLKGTENGPVELYHDNVKIFQTTGIGITVGLSTVAHNGNAAFAGIATVGTALSMGDSKTARFGNGGDLQINHNGTDSNILGYTGDLYIQNTGSDADDINIRAQDDINLQVDNGEAGIDIIGGGSVILYHHNNARITTTDDGADIGGTGALGVPAGNTASRSNPAANGDFRYNTDDNQFEGYSDGAWGAIAGSGGGATEVDTSVSTTSATSTGSFAKASFRSASIIAQITQGSAYQVGRYLLIHDGTTVTTIEESAVATGSMLGTFEGVINGSNVEFRVTMGSSSSATVTTKIDTVTV